MNFGELIVVAFALSMDAFAVAVCKGLSMKKASLKPTLTIGLYFGVFQALMPLLGYLLGSQFSAQIEAFDHWIAFGLLSLIGLKMVKDSFDEVCESDQSAQLNFRVMLPLALATSIDALVVGLSFALLSVQVVPAVTSIGVITMLLSMLGVKIGSVFGCKYKSKAELAGGIVLVLMGTKILFEHTGVLEKIFN